MLIDEKNNIINLPLSSLDYLPNSISKGIKEYKPIMAKPDVLIKSDESKSTNNQVEERNDDGEGNSRKPAKRGVGKNIRSRKA